MSSGDAISDGSASDYGPDPASFTDSPSTQPRDQHSRASRTPPPATAATSPTHPPTHPPTQPKSTPPLRPQRSVRSFPNGSRSPPMTMTPANGRSPRKDNIDLPMPESAPSIAAAAAAAAAAAIASSTSILAITALDDIDPAVVARAEADAIAQAEAEARPRTLSGVRALAKERARLRKEAALAAVNASAGIPSASAANPSDQDHDSLQQGGGPNKARRRQASRQDTGLRDALQVSLDSGEAPKQSVLANTSDSSEANSSDNRRSSAKVVGEFAQLDAALSAALDDLSFSSVGSAGTIRANTSIPNHLVEQSLAGAASQDLPPNASPQQLQQQTQHTSKSTTTAPSASSAAVNELVFPDQGAAPATAFAPSAAAQQPLQAPSVAAPLPSPALLASRERPPKAHGPVPTHAFIPALSTSASQPQPALSPTIPSTPSFPVEQQQPQKPQRRLTLPPPTDTAGHLLIYGKNIPFPEPYLNSNVPGMDAPERRRILLGNTNFNPMSISAPSTGLIHPTVERAKAYAAKTNALFAIETGLEVWVRAMGATRPGARNVYSSSSSSLPGVPNPSRRASAGAGLMLGNLTGGSGSGSGGPAGGPVSAAAAAYKQGMAGMNFGPSSRQLASGRTQSISASGALSNLYSQFGGVQQQQQQQQPSSSSSSSSGLPGATHPNRRDEASMATIRSDMTFPMRGDGARAKDITPMGHGVQMGSSESADSRHGGGFGGLPPQPESPPNAPPKNLPYPGVYAGRNNSMVSTISAASHWTGAGTEIPPRGSSIDLSYAYAYARTNDQHTIPPVPALPPTSMPMMRPLGSSASSSSKTSDSVSPPTARRQSLRNGPADLKLGPAPAFEPILSHGPRMPRSATTATTGGAAGLGLGAGTAATRSKATSDASAKFLSGSRAGAPSSIPMAGGGSAGDGGNRISGGPGGGGGGWADWAMAQDVATPGSTTTFMSAASHASSSSNSGGGNPHAVSISSSSPVALSASSGNAAGPGPGPGPGTGTGTETGASAGRQNKVLGPRAPKLSLSGAQAFEAAGYDPNGPSLDPGKRMSVSAGAGAGAGGSGSAADRFGLLAGFNLGGLPQDFGTSPSPRDLSPNPSASVSSLPGAAAPPPAIFAPGAGAGDSPQLIPSPQSATARRPTAATGFIPVGVSSKIRKASFGGQQAVTHSRDFFFSDLGRGAGTLGDAHGFGDEPVGAEPEVVIGSSPAVDGMSPSITGGGGGGGGGIGGSMLSPPGTPGMAISTSPNSGRSRTLSRSGSSVEMRMGGGPGSSVDTLAGADGGRSGNHGLPRSPSLADTSSFRGVSTSSLSYGSVRANSVSAASGHTASGAGSSSSKKMSKRMQFEETLAKMQDVIPDADRDVLSKYLDKANGNDLAAMHHYFADQAKGKIQSARSPRRNGY